jgi:hypothetical protein
MLEQNIQAHFDANLVGAKVQQSPFQYLFYENVFPIGRTLYGHGKLRGT